MPKAETQLRFLERPPALPPPPMHASQKRAIIVLVFGYYTAAGYISGATKIQLWHAQCCTHARAWGGAYTHHHDTKYERYNTIGQGLNKEDKRKKRREERKQRNSTAVTK